MSTDTFLIIASICIVILTILASIALIKFIKSLNEINPIIVTTKNVTANVSKALAAVASFGAFTSPLLGASKKIFKKRKTSKN